MKAMNGLNDKEIHRLGVTKIGDRVRLREACKKAEAATFNSQSSTNP